MADDQRQARLFGVLFIITFVTSIPAALLFQPLLDDPAGFIAGDGSEGQVYLGVFLEFLLIFANVGTAVVLYPIAKRQNKTLARSEEHTSGIHSPCNLVCSLMLEIKKTLKIILL